MAFERGLCGVLGCVLSLVFVFAGCGDDGGTSDADSGADSGSPTSGSSGGSTGGPSGGTASASGGSSADTTATTDTQESSGGTAGGREAACEADPNMSVARGRPLIGEGEDACLGEEEYLGCTSTKCGGFGEVCRDGVAYTVNNGCIPPGFDLCTDQDPIIPADTPLCD